MNDKLKDAMEHIRDDYLSEAATPRRRAPWIGMVAAILALVLLLGILWNPLQQIAPGTTGPAVIQGSHPSSTRRQPSTAVFPAHPNTTRQPSLAVNLAFGQVAGPDYPAYGNYSISTSVADRKVLTDIGSAVLAASDSKNPVCSPLNIYMALAMLAETTGGESRQQILDALGQTDLAALRNFAGQVWYAHYKDTTHKAVLANSLWLDDSISYDQHTADMLAMYYFASVYHGDLDSAQMQQAFKDWLNKETGGLLKDRVESIEIDPATIVTLASTLYYHTCFYFEFQQESNTQQPFHTATGDVTHTFMHTTLRYQYIYRGEGFTALALQLQDSSNLWLVLPDEGIDPAALTDFALRPRQSEHVHIDLSLPRFDISAGGDISDALKALGITDIFDANADFSPLLPEDPTVLGAVDHSVRVAVNEKGVTAAAYTSSVLLGMGPVQPSLPTVEITLDRPFLFSIISASDLPLFTGIVRNPAA